MILSRRSLRRSILGLFFLLTTGNLSMGQETSFAERFALASDREAVLRELIPGTTEYFYYHCLHYQTIGNLPEARRYVDTWIQQVGVNPSTQRMLTRQFLLEYPKSPQATIDHLIQTYGVNLVHPAPQKDEAASLSTKLDSATLDWKRILDETAKASSGVHQIEDAYLVGIASLLTSPADIRTWVSRIRRVDAPALVEMISKELKMNDSRGFGWASIHKELTLEQLQALRKSNPGLDQSGAFVETYLKRLLPTRDEQLSDLQSNASYMDRLESFVSGLPEVHVSLLANVLHRRLDFDSTRGIYDRKRFLRYLQIPSSRPNAQLFLSKIPNRTRADFQANFQAMIGLRPIQDDSGLVKLYLEHFFQEDQDIEGFAQFLDRDYLVPLFASTKILYGLGDAKKYYAQLSPEQQRELQSRIEVKFAPNNLTYFRPEDPVRIELNLKNVSELLVRIYRLNARNVLSQSQAPISTAIDLDGLVANQEKRLTFTQLPERRHKATLDLSELSGAGVWVVECLAGGQRSRALIHKGHLQSIQSISDGGHVLRIMNESGEWVPSAKVLFGEREFRADANGEILIPFGDATAIKPIVLCDGNLATLEQFLHRGEHYELKADFLLDPQAVLAGSKTAVLIRPTLLMGDQPVPLSNVTDAELRITTTDLDGISSTQTVANLKLEEASELALPFVVPPRLASVAIKLEGKVLTLHKNVKQSVSADFTATFSDFNRSSLIHDFYLTQSSEGYRFEVLGRNGEPKSRQPVNIEIKLAGLTTWQTRRLASNENGIIELGSLTGVDQIRVSSHELQQREFFLGAGHVDLPAKVHALADTRIEIPAREIPTSVSKVLISRWTLNEVRFGNVVSNWNSKLTHQNGLVSISGLPAGDYLLIDHWSGSQAMVCVTKGKEQGDVYIGQHRTLPTNSFSKVRINSVQVADGKLKIHVADHDPLTRIHILGTAFDQSRAHRFGGRSHRLDMPAIERLTIPSFYVDSLKLDDEYQYVLARQAAKKFKGNLLPHPSVILNPWEISATRNESQLAQRGDALLDKAGMPAAPPGASTGGMDAMSDTQASLAHAFDFLARGTLLMVNQRPDKEGKIELDVESFEGLPTVTVVLIHPTMTMSEKVTLPLTTQRELKDRRLASSFDADKHFSQQSRIRVLPSSDREELGEASLTRVRLYSSISELFPLYQSLLKGNQEFEKFRCLAGWASLTLEQKCVHYGELACHELHFFLYMHDRAFFDKVVRPHLVNKYPKQFMDDWLLERDLTKYLEPWQLQRLNAFERILIAKRIQSQGPSSGRWVRDYVAANPIKLAEREELFSIGMRGVSLGLELQEQSLYELAMRPGRLEQSKGFAGMGTSSGPSDPTSRSVKSPERAKKQKSSDSLRLGESVDDFSNGPGGAEAKMGRMLRRGGEGERVPFFEKLQETKVWAESQYYRVPLATQNAMLIKPSDFWLEYLQHDGKSPFLSKNLELAANLNEAILAMSVIGLPLEAKPAEITFEENQLVVKNVPASIAYIQGIVQSEAASDPSKLLLSREIYALTADEKAKPLDPKTLIRGVPYRAKVVITNPTASIATFQLFTQIPAGAIPLDGGKLIGTTEMELAPYSTQVYTNSFYFPNSGEFDFYGVQLSTEGRYVSSTESSKLKVLDRPEIVDNSTWEYVAAWGSTDAVVAFLNKANLSQINLGLIAWRLADPSAWKQIVEAVESAGRYDETVWSYSLKHKETNRIKEYLNANPTLVEIVGPSFRSELLHVDSVERFRYEHLDFRPIVVARSHMLGSKRIILNDRFSGQFETFMQYLSGIANVDMSHRMSIVYYMILQNRIEEAIQHFQQIDRTRIEAAMQYDYFDAYLAVTQGEYDRADSIALKHLETPVPRWKDWFQQLNKQVADRKRLQAGAAIADVSTGDWSTDPTQRTLSSHREGDLASGANKLPSLDISHENGQIQVEYRNLESMQINYYLMDVELLFSRNPFVQQKGSHSSLIEPNRTEEVKLTKNGTVERWIWKQPAELANKNVVVEFVAKGLVRSVPVYANSLSVSLSTTLARLQVQSKDGKQPIDGAYVKVFSKHSDGSVRFFKDGYTDLRGQYDYGTLSTEDLATTQRFAILVLHPEYGALIRECDPPKGASATAGW